MSVRGFGSSDFLRPLYEKITASPFLFIFTLITVTLCLATRLTSGRPSQTTQKGVKTATVLPYWVPYLGHIPWLTIFPKKLEEARSATSDGVFGISINGAVHNVVVKPSLVKAFLQLKPTIADNHTFIWYIWHNFFGGPPELHDPGDDFIFNKIHAANTGFMKESFLGNAVPLLAKGVADTVLDLVSFKKSTGDQNAWEQASNVHLLPSDPLSAEVSFFPLIRDFTALNASPTLMGSAFMKNYPNIIQDIWEFDAGMPLFMMKMPYWLPIPMYTKARAARQRLCNAMIDFFTAISNVLDGKDPGPQWQDLSDVAQVMWERCRIWRSSGLKLQSWAGSELVLLWAMNVNANNVVFWLLGRIYSSPEILTGIRNELSSFVLCTEKKCELNIDGITKSCPLLKAAYFECLRMDVVTTTFKKSNADFTITESTSDTFGGPQQTYLIKKGEHIHLAYSLHHTDPRYFSEPGIFRPERFLVEEEGEGGEAKLVAQQGTLRPYGGGHSLCKGYKFAEKEILLIVASVLTTWDAIPVTGEWKLPRQIRASGAYIPAGDWRLRLSRRQ